MSMAPPPPALGDFQIKDSGQRQEFDGGMVRDTTEGKTNFLNALFGPMFRRYAEHLTKGRIKYPDPEPGVPNWTLAEGKEEFLRAKESALRHMILWLEGARDEDHAAAVIFNVNLAEYVLTKAGARGEYIDPALGAGIDLEPKIDLGGCDRCDETAPHSHIEDRPLQVGDRVRSSVLGRVGTVVEPRYPEDMLPGEVVVDYGDSSTGWYQKIVELERVG